MSELSQIRGDFNQEFVEHICVVFQGVGYTFLTKIEGKSKTSHVLRSLREIVWGDPERNGEFRQNQDLLRRLASKNSEDIKERSENISNLSTMKILRLAIQNTKKIKDSDKTLNKLLEKYARALNGKRAKKEKLVDLDDSINREWLSYKESVRSQTLVLANLDEKLSQADKVGQKARKLLCKLVNKTRRLTRLYRGDPHQSSDSGSSSSENERQEQITSPRNQDKNKSKSLKASGKQEKISKGIVKKLTKPGLYKIEPWPLGNPQGPGIRPQRPVDYAMFLAPPAPAVSDTSRNMSNETLVEPSPSLSATDSATAKTVNYDMFQAGSQTCRSSPDEHQTDPLGPKQAWQSTSPVAPVPVTTPLRDMLNVYVKVTKKYKATDKTELTLKVGQTVKQKRTADDQGMAYGWMKSFGLKKYGFYPVSHVVLKGGE